MEWAEEQSIALMDIHILGSALETIEVGIPIDFNSWTLESQLEADMKEVSDETHDNPMFRQNSDIRNHSQIWLEELDPELPYSHQALHIVSRQRTY